ncbi:PEGA domain-containing protein [Patescibacteria group bacterium]|nr:PEGA domain-containing protein [Patescibacteria group bacterium]
MKRKTQKKGSSSVYAIILIAILAVSLFLFYSENLKGAFKINSVEGSVNIFIDGEDKGFSEITKEGQTVELKEGSHSIILSQENYWPWAKEIQISKQQTTDIYPFFVPINSSGFIIPNTDPEYSNIMAMFWKKIHIDWEMDENTPEIIKEFKEEIRASDFYKDRTDVIIVAVQNGIFALEIDNGFMPNFQPIYKGTEPTFVKNGNNSLYVKDGELLMEVLY